MQIANVAGVEKPSHEVIHRVRAGEHDPVERSRVPARLVERSGILGFGDADGIGGDRFGAAFLEHVDELSSLFPRARNHDASS